nr:hypothetical protein [Planctomycetota bacterium]
MPMPRILPVAALAALAILPACMDRAEGAKPVPTKTAVNPPAKPDPRVAAPAEQQAPMHREAEGALVSVSETDKQVLVELPLGSADEIEPGTFLRVYDPADAHLLVGLIQITEVLGDHRAVARQMGLSDNLRHLQPKDRAHEIRDLAQLIDGKAIADQARKTEADFNALDAADQQRYASLRTQYQQALAAAQTRFDAQLTATAAAGEKRLAESDAAHRHQLELELVKARTDLAALRTAMAEQVAAGISGDRKAQEERFAALTAERANLQAQVDSLLHKEQEIDAHAAAVIKEQAERDRVNQATVSAEVEARQVLQARLDELEARLAGHAVAPITVLANDPTRNETVLEKVNRLNRELNVERERAKRLEAALSESQAGLASAHQSVTALEQRIAELGPADARARQLDDDLGKARTALADSERQRAALELARLEAERSLYD